MILQMFPIIRLLTPNGFFEVTSPVEHSCASADDDRMRSALFPTVNSNRAYPSLLSHWEFLESDSQDVEQRID